MTFLRLFLPLTLTLLFFGLSPLHALSSPSVPQVLATPKGHTLWYLHTPLSPVTALHAIYPFSYRALKNHNPALHRIIANLSEKLLTTRTKSFNPITTTQILNNYAAHINIDITSLHIAVRMHFVTSTKHALQPLFHATLNENFVDNYNLNRFKIAEKKQLTESLKSPDTRLWRTFVRTMFQDSPWGTKGLTSPDMISKTSISHIMAFNATWQHTPPRFIALTSMSKDETIQFVDSLIPKKTTSTSFPPPPIHTSPQAWGQHIHLQDKDLRQTKIMLTLPGLARSHPDAYTLRILSHILQDQYLFPSIREERGLAYSVSAYPLFYPSSGFVFIQSATQQEQAHQTISLIKQAILNITQNTVSLETLQAAQQAAINSLSLGLTHNSTIADTFTQPLRDNESPDIFTLYTQEFNAVTPEKLLSLAQRLWRTPPLLITVGPSPLTTTTP